MKVIALVFKLVFFYPIMGLVIWSLIDSFITLRWIYKHEEEKKKKQGFIKVS